MGQTGMSIVTPNTTVFGNNIPAVGFAPTALPGGYGQLRPF